MTINNLVVKNKEKNSFNFTKTQISFVFELDNFKLEMKIVHFCEQHMKIINTKVSILVL